MAYERLFLKQYKNKKELPAAKIMSNLTLNYVLKLWDHGSSVGIEAGVSWCDKRCIALCNYREFRSNLEKGNFKTPLLTIETQCILT